MKIIEIPACYGGDSDMYGVIITGQIASEAGLRWKVAIPVFVRTVSDTQERRVPDRTMPHSEMHIPKYQLRAWDSTAGRKRIFV